MKTQLMIVLVLAAGTAMAQRGQGNRQPPTAKELISRLDKDGDGQISQSEFDGPDEHFTQFDTNNDGNISEDELSSGSSQRQQRGQRGTRSFGTEFVERLDKNDDGKVSTSEFDGTSQMFSELDKDNDGYVSESEAPSGPPPRGRR